MPYFDTFVCSGCKVKYYIGDWDVLQALNLPYEREDCERCDTCGDIFCDDCCNANICM